LSDLKTKQEKLYAVAQNYQIDPSKLKEYLIVAKEKKKPVAPDRV